MHLRIITNILPHAKQNELESTLTAYPSPLPGLGVPTLPSMTLHHLQLAPPEGPGRPTFAELLLTSVLTGNVYNSNGSAPFPYAANKRSGGWRCPRSIILPHLRLPQRFARASNICAVLRSREGSFPGHVRNERALSSEPPHRTACARPTSTQRHCHRKQTPSPRTLSVRLVDCLGILLSPSFCLSFLSPSYQLVYKVNTKPPT
ncbi:hypothetical protein BC826DRAFT_175167 [Russula brevipes]|nr:hypothetical protein BC826DRAFT_175167 [Russula brevipes]